MNEPVEEMPTVAGRGKGDTLMDRLMDMDAVFRERPRPDKTAVQDDHEKIAVTGINHVTFAVRNLNAALSFYHHILGLTLVLQWAEGAYLQAGTAWIALNVDENVAGVLSPSYSHIAFDVTQENFEVLAERILSSGAHIWNENKSEGPSLYFTDPDDHKLEIHASNLNARIIAMSADEATCVACSAE